MGQGATLKAARKGIFPRTRTWTWVDRKMSIKIGLEQRSKPRMWERAERRDGKIVSGPKDKGLFPVSLTPSLSSRKIRNQNSKNRELYCQR